ncbi:hypothetical protein [Candidatus Spongiihabitans sp.]|uniref:hypothetical protein n=1 Tax=Candidatus Spongiihabitans sp. TaxID=3101308 RepID=UPI003C7CB951
MTFITLLQLFLQLFFAQFTAVIFDNIGWIRQLSVTSQVIYPDLMTAIHAGNLEIDYS